MGLCPAKPWPSPVKSASVSLPPGARTRRVSPSAVAWIDEDEALVAQIAHDGAVSTCHIQRGGLPEPSYLAHVVRAIGDRERVVMLWDIWHPDLTDAEIAALTWLAPRMQDYLRAH